MDHQVTIAGIPLPSDAVWFLAVIAVHVAAGITAAVAGLVAMLSSKAIGRHPRAGSLYYWALVVVNLTMAPIVGVRWPTDNALGLLGVIAFGTAFFGRRARRRGARGWQCVHIPCMAISYITLLTAFYVDNGPHLPLRNRLPPIALWLMPVSIGLPLLAFSWLRRCPPRRTSGRLCPQLITAKNRRGHCQAPNDLHL